MSEVWSGFKRGWPVAAIDPVRGFRYAVAYSFLFVLWPLSASIEYFPMNAFSALGLSAPLIQALRNQGYTSPTPIQRKAVPAILKGRDLLAAAQTGTGKTAAFALPILQRLALNAAAGKGVRALILTPTRELAAQVAERVQAYGTELALTSALVHGGVPIEPQLEQLKQGVDILIATPGRLLDLLYQGGVKLGQVETLVLDEADRMLDLGFIDDVQKIIARMPSVRQTLLFSATLPPAVVALTEGVLKDPLRVDISPAQSTAQTVKQSVYKVEWEDKPDTVRYLVEEGRWERVLVFIRTKKSADDLVQYLQQEGLSAAAIHSNKSQILRTRTLAAFKSAKIRVLVATDIAARGLDIAELPLVINYDLPRVAEDYVHRIGRSGRAGVAGRAMSLLSGSERKWMQAIEKLIKRQLPAGPLPFFELGVEQPVDSGENETVGKTRNKSRSAKPGKPKSSAVKRTASKGAKSDQSRLKGKGFAASSDRSRRSQQPATKGRGTGQAESSARQPARKKPVRPSFLG